MESPAALYTLVNPGAAPIDDGGLPAPRREPPITIAPDFKTVQDCKSTITVLDFGQFMVPSWLLSQMLWNSRLRGVTNTRLDGLVGTEIRWEPGRLNETGRRAARDIVEDWPLMVTAAMRKQIAEWGLFLGAGFAQQHWYTSPKSQRRIPRVETYHPQWAIWDWAMRAYRIWTLDGWALVPSPSIQVPGEPWAPLFGPPSPLGKPDTLKRWIVVEPWGKHSFQRGLMHSGWDPWLALVKANAYLNRSAEKMGAGLMKLKYPKTTDTKALEKFMGALGNLGSEAVLPVEVYKDDAELASYDVEPFEWQQTGADIIRAAREAANSDLAVLLLGHNTTAETKGASVGASAQVGNLIRGDIRVGDTYNEFAWVFGQLLPNWAEENYGDPGVAPIPIYVTDPPSENQAAATTLFNVAQAVALLRANCPGVDFSELLNRFRVPLTAGGAQVLPPPAPTSPPTSSPAKET